MKRLPAVLIGLILVFFCTHFIEKYPRFTSSKRIVQRQTIPSEILAYGSLGRIMKRLNVVSSIPRSPSPRLNLQQKSSLLEQFQFEVNPGRMQSMPSSLVISESDFKAGWPLLSIVMDEEDLYDPTKGILTFKKKKRAGMGTLGLYFLL